MNQETFNNIISALVFASSVDCCGDENVLDKTIDYIPTLLDQYPDFMDGLDLGETTLYGSIERSEQPEVYKKLVSIFGDKLKVTDY